MVVRPVAMTGSNPGGGAGASGPPSRRDPPPSRPSSGRAWARKAAAFPASSAGVERGGGGKPQQQGLHPAEFVVHRQGQQPGDAQALRLQPLPGRRMGGPGRGSGRHRQDEAGAPDQQEDPGARGQAAQGADGAVPPWCRPAAHSAPLPIRKRKY